MAKFIVLDGADGSGKGTQFDLLANKLNDLNISFETADFPQYNKQSSYFVAKYLRGEYGEAKELGARIPSIFYALDRFDESEKLRATIQDEKIKFLISNRYTSANCGHQGGKIRDEQEREKYLNWLFSFEHELLRIPKPDLTIFLHVPAEIAQELVDKKGAREYTHGKKRDIHEADLDHLEDAIEAFKYCVKKFDDWKQIDCFVDGKLLTPFEVHEKVWDIVKQYC